MVPTTPLKKKSKASSKPTPPKVPKPEKHDSPDAETKRLAKNAHSKAYHQAVLRAVRDGSNKEEASALGRAAGLKARNAFLANLA